MRSYAKRSVGSYATKIISAGSPIHILGRRVWLKRWAPPELLRQENAAACEAMPAHAAARHPARGSSALMERPTCRQHIFPTSRKHYSVNPCRHSRPREPQLCDGALRQHLQIRCHVALPPQVCLQRKDQRNCPTHNLLFEICLLWRTPSEHLRFSKKGADQSLSIITRERHAHASDQQFRCRSLTNRLQSLTEGDASRATHLPHKVASDVQHLAPHLSCFPPSAQHSARSYWTSTMVFSEAD